MGRAEWGGTLVKASKLLKNESEVQKIALRGEAGGRSHAGILASPVAGFVGCRKRAETWLEHAAAALEKPRNCKLCKWNITAAADLTD